MIKEHNMEVLRPDKGSKVQFALNGSGPFVAAQSVLTSNFRIGDMYFERCIEVEIGHNPKERLLFGIGHTPGIGVCF